MALKNSSHLVISKRKVELYLKSPFSISLAMLLFFQLACLAHPLSIMILKILWSWMSHMKEFRQIIWLKRLGFHCLRLHYLRAYILLEKPTILYHICVKTSFTSKAYSEFYSIVCFLSYLEGLNTISHGNSVLPPSIHQGSASMALIFKRLTLLILTLLKQAFIFDKR